MEAWLKSFRESPRDPAGHRVGEVAIEAATRLAELHLGAHHATKRRVRKETLAVLRKSLDEDMSDIGKVDPA